MVVTITEKHHSSFRDPSGFIFTRDGNLYRQVNQEYKDNYDLFLSSKLYETLVKENLLVAHEEVSVEPMNASAYKVIQPQQIPFISYPSEWCFSELKDAALLTMDVVLRSLDAGMILKDASAYNVQFYKGKPILVDTLSFEKYVEGQPWIGYRQFCQHFLAPLALMSYKDTRLGRLSSIYIDGVPLDLASSLLPGSTWFNHRLLTHIHLHSRWQAQSGESSEPKQVAKMPLEALKALLADLRGAVAELKIRSVHSVWADYTQNNNYEAASALHKKKLVAEFLGRLKPKTVIDLGANTGDYSRLVSSPSLTISADFDHDSVEINYKRCVSEGATNILPLVVDLTNPTSAFGFENKERMSFIERANADLIMALALIHHMAIANNVPMNKVAQFFRSMAKYLIIEFVSKEDSQVQRLLESREDIFADYTKEGFETAFGECYSIEDCLQIEGSQRWLYLMKASDN